MMASSGEGVDASTWEEVLTAFSGEVWAWSFVAEGRVPSRAILRARELARDLQVAAGLFEVVPWARVEVLIDAAHDLLQTSGAEIQGLPIIACEGWSAPSSEPTRGTMPALSDEGESEEEATLPGVPPDVFRRYLVSLFT
jgi:hypothetical protein